MCEKCTQKQDWKQISVRKMKKKYKSYVIQVAKAVVTTYGKSLKNAKANFSDKIGNKEKSWEIEACLEKHNETRDQICYNTTDCTANPCQRSKYYI